MTVYRIAMVVPNLAYGGGVSAAADFLREVIAESKRYEPYLFSLPVSSRDKSSVRLISPITWFRGPQIAEGTWNGRPYQHVGAFATEFEFQRYQPRQALTRILSEFDLVQVVSGSPTWAYATRHVQKPVCLLAASLTMVERQALFRQVSWPRRYWLRAMSQIVSRIEEAALSHLAAAFVLNHWMYDHLSQRMDPGRVIFAPSGVDPERFHPGQYRSDSYILSVGRLGDPRKNVPLLFHAYQRLRLRHPAAPPLVLAGKSMPGSDVWQLAESLGILNHIEKKENLSIDELADLYRNASLFVLSSDEEGLGIVVIEAMASGIPVVATRCGGTETTVVDGITGQLVPTNDAEALAQNMARVLADPDQAERLGRAGRKRALERFSPAASANKFLDIYDRLLP